MNFKYCKVDKFLQKLTEIRTVAEKPNWDPENRGQKISGLENQPNY